MTAPAAAINGVDLAAVGRLAQQMAAELVIVSGPRDDVVFPLDADVVPTLRASHRPAPPPGLT